MTITFQVSVPAVSKQPYLCSKKQLSRYIVVCYLPGVLGEPSLYEGRARWRCDQSVAHPTTRLQPDDCPIAPHERRQRPHKNLPPIPFKKH